MIFGKLLSGIDGGRVLDVGCGTGQFIPILVKSLASFESVTGVDVDPRSIEEARGNFPGKEYIFRVVGSRMLPFSDASFDMVAISKALHHVDDPEGTLQEMKRVTKTGGYILISELLRNGLSGPQKSHMMYHHLSAEIDTALGVSHHFTFHRETLIQFASQLDLQDTVIEEFTPDSENPGKEQAIRGFSDKMDTWLKRLEGHPGKDYFTGRIEKIRLRFRKHGVSMPPQLVILGRK